MKTTLKSLHHAWFHPNVAIGRNSTVDRKAIIEKQVTIGARCNIFKSSIRGNTRIGDDCLVNNGCRIGSSQLDANVGFEAGVQVYNSHFAENIRIQTNSYLDKAIIGRFSYVGREAYLNQVEVGAFVSIGPRCMIGLGEHPSHFPTTSPALYSNLMQCGASFATVTSFEERKVIKIGNDVWIGASAFIRDGITIGDGAIIGAGSVVTKDVEPYAIVGGIPAKLIRFRSSPENIRRLRALQWWHWHDEKIQRLQPLFSQSDLEAFLRMAETEN